ncbi:hypothetical protein IC229_27495 [Spirosoma sp. BT702]|uniref:Uncharacterized protein n=1 Tax=Spirosoma profusum TaxID=2771354 RepID=A0A926Y1M4_9BACT|nr:hypothetical protein [Spirosoma profusum]MBD2704416.1 hypothetical protein [Spirosoma profusum]
MKTFLFLLVSIACFGQGLPVQDLATLRAQNGGVGTFRSVTSTGQIFTWKDSVMTHNGVNVVVPVGMTKGGWLQTGASLSGSIMPVSTSLTGGTTGETNLFVTTIPGNVLQTNKSVQFSFDFRLTSTLVVSSNLTLKVYYGTQSVTIQNSGVVAASLTNRAMTLIGRLYAYGSTNSQKMRVTLTQDGQLLGSSNRNYVEIGDFTVDSTTDQTLRVTGQITTGVGTMTLYSVGGNKTNSN